MFRPTIAENVSEKIVDSVKETFAAEGLQRELCTRGGKRVIEQRLLKAAAAAAQQNAPDGESKELCPLETALDTTKNAPDSKWYVISRVTTPSLHLF